MGIESLIITITTTTKATTRAQTRLILSSSEQDLTLSIVSLSLIRTPMPHLQQHRGSSNGRPTPVLPNRAASHTFSDEPGREPELAMVMRLCVRLGRNS
jgi:hypothetical protein